MSNGPGNPGVTKVNGAAYPGIWVEKQVTFVKITFSSDISALPAADLYELGTTTAVSSGTVADGTFGVVNSVLVQAIQTLETNATVLGISQYAQTGATAGGSTTASAGSATSTITLTSATGFAAGQTITVTGTGAVAPGTKIVSVTGTTIVISTTPITPLVTGDTITSATYSGGQVDVMLGYAESWFSDTTGAIASSLPITIGQAVIVVPGSAVADSVGTLVSVNPSTVTFGLEFSYLSGTLPVATGSNGMLTSGPGATSGATPTNSPVGTSGFYPVNYNYV